MLSIAYYFLQVSLCSALMMLYYALILRNKRFHQYNRFYLLSVAILPWLMPLIKIDINKPKEAVSIPIQLFSVIADTNSEFEKTVADKGFQFTWETLIVTMYIAVSGVLLTMLLIAMVKIYKLLKTNSCENLDDVYLVLTQANGTPFSFFKFIFWHTDIDVTTSTGKQMLRHELTHVYEKHSADKLLLQIVLIVGWPNPIFWLLKRELETIHEFIADNKAIDNGDTAALATMLLAAAYPQQRFALTNPFFYSPIKRRIAMLTNNKNPRFSYARRLVVLPLLVVITLLFAFRKKEIKPITLSVASALENVVDAVTNSESIATTGSNATVIGKLTKTYTVVIDAGHGGTDAGAPGIDGKSFEKDIALSIAKLVKAQNANANINIVLTRDNDVFLTPPQRVDYVNKLGADLFVSLHCNSDAPIKTSNGYKASPARGYEVVIPSRERPGMEDCKLLASSINSVFNSSSFAVGQVVQKKVGIWVLQATNCPATLIECGYVSSKEDLKMLKNLSNQQIIATNILKGIETYLVSKENKQEVAVLKEKKSVISGVTPEELEKYDAFVEKFNPYAGHSITDADREWLFSIYQKMTSEQKAKARISFIVTPKIIKKVPTKTQWNDWLTKDRNTVCVDNKLVSKAELSKYAYTDFVGYADYDVLKKGFPNASSMMNNVYLFTKENFKKTNEEYSKRKWWTTIINPKPVDNQINENDTLKNSIGINNKYSNGINKIFEVQVP
ncbi:N-acetylmuramoyl-L-alanine amidase [Parasediminibacterium paludis]|uniref:N-acetylmuramoyl-L-alanine amidase n=1 Tax=Parasediminibacterium paludis TaxID=908966 RepID=A0ABV8PSC6_9BACT